jgi:enamine deaminase RidA (YjgF/YER057c/UK114 family)
MERAIASPHEIRNPETLPPPMGFSHAVIAQAGRTVYLAGQTAQQTDGTVVGATLAEQFDVAAGNVVKALEAAGAHPQDLVSMQIFVTDVAEYQRTSKEIGDA